MAVRVHRIAQQDAELVAVCQQPDPFTICEQYALGTPRWAEPIGTSAASRRIEVGITSTRPCTQPRTAARLHQPAAVFAAFACRHIILADRAIETQAFGERRDDMIANALGTTDCDELSANGFPVALEALALDVMQQAQSGQVRMQIEPHERFWQCRTEERAITQIKRHARDGGTSMSKPSGRRTGGCIAPRAVCSLPRC
jgi:hypothetical protein